MKLLKWLAAVLVALLWVAGTFATSNTTRFARQGPRQLPAADLVNAWNPGWPQMVRDMRAYVATFATGRK